MMDRNREARRAAAMTNGLPRRRHRTSTTGGSLRESPEDEGPVELQETAARLRDRTAKKDRDREMRERERDRLNRSKRRRSDKYEGVGGGGGGGGGGDDGSSEDSVNDEEDEDEDGSGVRYVPPSSNNPVLVSSTSAASSTLTHRKSYPPPNKVFRVAPTWKAPDEMIGVSIPRKARSASTKRGHDCWSAAAAGEQVNHTNRQATPSPGRSTTGVAQSQQQAAIAPSPLQAPPRPMSPSPSSSNVSIKKKIKANGPKHHQHHQQQRPPKSTPKTTSSPSSMQDDIEIEVAEVLYGLMRQSQAPPASKLDGGTGISPNDSTKLDYRSNNNDSKSRVSSPAHNSSSVHNLNHHHNNNNHTSTSASSTPLTTVAPKRKRPRPYPEETPSNMGHRSNPKVETDQTPKIEAASPMAEKKSSEENGGEMVNSQEAQAQAEAVASTSAAMAVAASSGVQSDSKVEESPSNGTMIRNGLMLKAAKVEETSSSPKLESSYNQTIHDRVESSTTSTKQNSSYVEHENQREDKLEIDLMAPPPQSRGSPERGEEEGEYGGGGDENCMVTEREAEAKPITKPKDEVDEKGSKIRIGVNVGEVESTAVEAEQPKLMPSLSSQAELNLSGKDKERRSIDVQFDLEKSSVNEEKLNFQKQVQQAAPPSKTTRDDANTDTKHGGQSGSGQLPMSVPGGWHGGLPPMGYVGPLQGVVSMDGTPMASPPIQHPSTHFMYSPPRPTKRCATHCHIAKNISCHQQMIKMNPFFTAAAAVAGTAPSLFGGKPPYNLNMVPSADVHAAAGRGVVVNSSQDNKGQPFTFFPGQPTSSKDKSPLPTSNASDSASKKFLLQPGLPPGAPNNLLPGPALFFPMGQQQPAVANTRPSTTKSPSSTGAVSASASTSVPMSAVASNGGPAMSFSYPNMGGSETQFMAILGNSPYPFPIPAHVGAAPPYRGSHPQPMSFFNGSFYSSQMLHHPSQLQQQQAAQQQSQSMQMQQQTQPNASISTASSSSQKQLQSMQQQRPQGNSGNPNQGLQNFQVNKGRASQPHHEMGSEDSPSTADSRTRPNMSSYGQNFAMPPFHSPNFALMTPPSSMGSNAPGVPNGNTGDKKQQQPQQTPPFPMSFATVNGATTPGLDMSSLAHNHALIQSFPEAAKQQLMAAAVAAHAQQNKKNSYRGPEDGKTGAVAATDPSNVDEERKALAARSSASVGQSIAFSRDLSENSMPGNNVVDTSARSMNLIQGSSTRPNRSSGQNTMSNSNASSNHQQMQQQQQLQQQQQQHQQQQMLFTKQQQYVGSATPSSRSKTPTTSNGNVYPDHLTSSSVMAAKFPNNLSSFPPLVQQTSGAPAQSSQWKNSVRPNSSQVSSPPIATSNASNIKHLPQQQGRSQQTHTQISFGATPNQKAPSTAQGQQAQSNNQAPSSPMVVGSPSTSSVSKGASGSPRTTASASAGNKQGGQASSLSSQQGKNSQSPLLSSQKPSILGSPHHLMPSSNSGNKPQSQQSQQQPQLSRQSIQQAQLFFNNAYMQASANTSAAMAGGGYYLQRHRPDNQQHQQQQQQQQQQQHGSKSQGMGTTPTSGMLSLCTPVSMSNNNTSDPAKAVAAAAANMKGGMPSQGIFHAAQFAAQSAGGTHQLMPAGFPYVHAVSTAVQVKPAEQKQPAGE